MKGAHPFRHCEERQRRSNPSFKDQKYEIASASLTESLAMTKRTRGGRR
ncbi:MAG: hypothetical protein ACPLSK_02370 [bacterium]